MLVSGYRRWTQRVQLLQCAVNYLFPLAIQRQTPCGLSTIQKYRTNLGDDMQDRVGNVDIVNVKGKP